MLLKGSLYKTNNYKPNKPNSTMKRLLFTLFFTLMFVSVKAQPSDQEIAANKSKMERIKADPRFLCDFGYSDTVEVALHKAVVNLASQIHTEVNIETVTVIEIKNSNGEINEKQTHTTGATTTTNVVLKKCERFIVAKPDRKNNKYTAFAFIEKKVADEINAEIEEAEEAAKKAREQKFVNDVNAYYRQGTKAVEDYRIGDALKYWYWAYLMSSDKDITIGGTQAAPLIEGKIDKLLGSIQVNAVSCEKIQINEYQEKYNVILDIKYKDSLSKYHKVTNLDYIYNDGYGWLNVPIRANDGVGTLELHSDLDEVDFQCVYRYGENETPEDIRGILKAKEAKGFASAMKKVSITKKAKHTKDVVVSTGEMDIPVAPSKKVSASVAEEDRDYMEMQRRMERIEKAIREKNYISVQQFFTTDGYDCFEKLVKTGKGSIVGIPQYTFIPYEDITICRCITMQFRFRNNKEFIEKVSFRFNADNLVESLAFQLSEVAEGDIMNNGTWERASRLALLTFLEDYQTAYALKREHYLDTIFSDKALIIIGYKVESRVLSDGVRLRESVRYDTLQKPQYIERLKRQFNTKEYINLNFTETDFRRATDGEEVYGIRVRQEYFSSDYGDVGWLFLYVDLRHELPIIHVRAWQNDKTPLNELIDRSDFY